MQRQCVLARSKHILILCCLVIFIQPHTTSADTTLTTLLSGGSHSLSQASSHGKPLLLATSGATSQTTVEKGPGSKARGPSLVTKLFSLILKEDSAKNGIERRRLDATFSASTTGPTGLPNLSTGASLPSSTFMLSSPPQPAASLPPPTPNTLSIPPPSLTTPTAQMTPNSVPVAPTPPSSLVDGLQTGYLPTNSGDNSATLMYNPGTGRKLLR